MGYMSQNLRLSRLSNLSVLNSRFHLLVVNGITVRRHDPISDRYGVASALVP